MRAWYDGLQRMPGILFAAILLLLPDALRGQPGLAGAARIRLELERLRVLGSVLMTAAHPDDENTALLAWFARGRKVRTAYLSLTRGEGGQNLIGPEQGDALGLIRTQELLAARRIDGAEQYFTRAVDFGFSKSAEETLAKWGREQILADMVWVIRRFRPDVMVLRFSGTARDGHGHHQASAILGQEAFHAAGDPRRFPEQLRWVQPWQPRRLMWNVFGAPRQSSLGAVEVEVGEFDPVLGYSYTEIAGMSRSMHRSQGFGAPQRRGSTKNYLVVLAGAPAQSDPFEGIDITWNRLPGGAAIDAILAQAVESFRPEDPARIIPLLARVRPLIAALRDPWAEHKLADLDEAIALCAGLWVDAAARQAAVQPGADLRVRIEALNRCALPARLLSVTLEDERGAHMADSAPAELTPNQPQVRELVWKFADDAPYSAPFWLVTPRRGEAYSVEPPRLGMAENPPVLRAAFRVAVGPAEIHLKRPVRYRYVDRVLGEQARRLEVVPAVALRLPHAAILFPSQAPRKIEVELTGQKPGAAGELRLEVPAGWRVAPASHSFRLAEEGQQITVAFELTPPAREGIAQLRAVARVGGRDISAGVATISYPHIEPVTWLPAAEARLVRADVRISARRIGYIMGAGDDLPEALRQLGCEVSLLDATELARGDLSRFDALVTGVRAYNVRADLRANQYRLLEYVSQGGTLLVQYNTLDSGPAARSLAALGPFPLRIGRERVTVEDAPVSFPDPDHPLLRAPNRITAEDFQGWVQERGLYFAAEWDPRYEPLLISADPGEKPLAGGLLVARYGKGVYIFTALAWFRQLPAGVPGAYRIFANLLSAGQTLKQASAGAGDRGSWGDGSSPPQPFLRPALSPP